MINFKPSLLFFLLLLPNVIVAQIHNSQSPDQVNRRLEQWVEGQVVFVDRTVLDARFAYNPLLPEGMLKIEHEGKVIAGTVHDVESFHYFDPRSGQEREFVTFAVNNQLAFVEMLHDTPHYTLLGRPTVQVTIYSSYGYNSSGVEGKYVWYLYDKNTNEAHWLTKKTWASLLPDKKKEVRKYLRRHQSTMSTTQLYSSVINRFMEF